MIQRLAQAQPDLLPGLTMHPEADITGQILLEIQDFRAAGADEQFRAKDFLLQDPVSRGDSGAERVGGRNGVLRKTRNFSRVIDLAVHQIRIPDRPIIAPAPALVRADGLTAAVGIFDHQLRQELELGAEDVFLVGAAELSLEPAVGHGESQLVVLFQKRGQVIDLVIQALVVFRAAGSEDAGEPRAVDFGAVNAAGRGIEPRMLDLAPEREALLEAVSAQTLFPVRVHAGDPLGRPFRGLQQPCFKPRALRVLNLSVFIPKPDRPMHALCAFQLRPVVFTVHPVGVDFSACPEQSPVFAASGDLIRALLFPVLTDPAEPGRQIVDPQRVDPVIALKADSFHFYTSWFSPQRASSKLLRIPHVPPHWGG